MARVKSKLTQKLTHGTFVLLLSLPSRGGTTGAAALTFAPGWGSGRVFSQGASLRDKRLYRAGVARPSWARRNWRFNPSAY
jgi:hypothetical protein